MSGQSRGCGDGDSDGGGPRALTRRRFISLTGGTVIGVAFKPWQAFASAGAAARSVKGAYVRPRLRPFARVGRRLRFAEDLSRQRLWPLPIRPGHGEGGAAVKPLIPYLVAPADPFDVGARPLGQHLQTYSRSIELIDDQGRSVSLVTRGQQYRPRVTISNRGSGPAYSGIVDFYVGSKLAADAAAAGGAALPAQGRAGFVVQPGTKVVVSSPSLWSVTGGEQVAWSVVVHAYDLLLDRQPGPWDAVGNRQVARRDGDVPDFQGRWEGRVFRDRDGHVFDYRIVIEQTGSALAVQIFVKEPSAGAYAATPYAAFSVSLRRPDLKAVAYESSLPACDPGDRECGGWQRTRVLEIERLDRDALDYSEDWDNAVGESYTATGTLRRKS